MISLHAPARVERRKSVVKSLNALSGKIPCIYFSRPIRNQVVEQVFALAAGFLGQFLLARGRVRRQESPTSPSSARQAACQTELS